METFKFNLLFFVVREKKIAENMKKMPKMVEEYHEKMRALRKAKREKKAADEKKVYFISTGKEKEKPEWLQRLEAEKKKGSK